MKKHEDDAFSLQEYSDDVVKANQDCDLPGAEQAVLVNQGDSDSETEDEQLYKRAPVGTRQKFEHPKF